MKKNVLISGGTGLIGQRIISYLGTEDYNFRILSRSRTGSDKGVSYFEWDPANQNMDASALENIDVLINLAGASIAGERWSKERKKLIIDSRLDSIKTLTRYMADHSVKPELMIGASAVGYYGNRGDTPLREDDSPGEGFLAYVSKLWEQEYHVLQAYFNRSVIMRIGIVLSTEGGALKEMIKPAKAGIYGYFGSGESYYSWIHINDICEIVRQTILQPRYASVVNAVSPEPVTVKTLAQTLKKVKDSPGLVMPVPEFALKLALGEMSSVLLDSTRVRPARLSRLDHDFLFEDLEMALSDLFKKGI